MVTAYFVDRINTEAQDDIAFSYRDEFNTIDREFWYVGEWQTLFTAYDKVAVKNGILNLEVLDTDRGPFMLSKPIELLKGDVLTVKRRVKIHYTNDNFTGGFAILETEDLNLKPFVPNQSDWSDSLGNGVVLVEHVHNFDEESERPGRDVFRVLTPTWEKNRNYLVVEPIFDDWFEETIRYNTNNNTITYSINDDEYTVRGSKLNFENIRVFMHSYGFYTGHSNKIDWLEISIKRTEK